MKLPKPNTLRIVVLLLYATFLLAPLSCSPRQSPFLVSPPSVPFKSVPTIKVLFAADGIPVVPAGSNVRFINESGRIIFDETVPTDTNISSTSGGRIMLGQTGSLPEGRIVLTSSMPVRVGDMKLPYPLELTAAGKGVCIVALIQFEEYIAGVSQGEMYPSWPLEALKAHAVAARSYAMVNMLRKGADTAYHVKATKDSQRFLIPTSESCRKAAQDTRGLVLFYKNRILEAMYHAASGGTTAAAESVYDCRAIAPLSSVKITDEKSPFDNWTEQFNWPAFYKTVTLAKTIPNFRSIRTDRTADGTVANVEINHSDGTENIDGKTFRARLGLKSNDFSISVARGIVSITGRGNGHRIGMSQYGAKVLAEQNFDYIGILGYFYPASTIVRIY